MKNHHKQDDIYHDLTQMLHELVGMHGQYNGEEYELLEIIDHNETNHAEKGPAVVLKPIDSDPIIQASMFGEARRNVEPTFTVTALSEVQHGLHPTLAEFVGNKIQNMLETALPDNATQ